jgi:hypothetical protein
MKSAALLIPFYREQGCDTEGRTLRQIREFSTEQLECTHDYIQWLFPLPEPSSANRIAPILDGEMIAVFRESPELQEELRTSLRLMLRFYGLALEKTPKEPEVMRAANFDTRRAEWLRPCDHNYLRISRILRSLTVLGCAPEARALLHCLECVYLEAPDKIGRKTFDFWQRAVEIAPL